MADMDRVELLIGLSNNLRKENDAWRRDVWKEGRERAERCQMMIQRLEQEFGLLSNEFELVKQYLPRQVNATQALAEGKTVTSTGQGGSGGRS